MYVYKSKRPAKDLVALIEAWRVYEAANEKCNAEYERVKELGDSWLMSPLMRASDETIAHIREHDRIRSRRKNVCS